jgi:hypothetical protein
MTDVKQRVAACFNDICTRLHDECNNLEATVFDCPGNERLRSFAHRCCRLSVVVVVSLFIKWFEQFDQFGDDDKTRM